MSRRPTAFALALLIAIPLMAGDIKPAIDEKAAMDAMMKHGTPGEAHKKLEPLVGDWTFTAKFSMSPDAQPMEMTDMGALETTMRMIKAETQLMYSSDYPHWDFDLPSTIYDLPFLSETAKHNILGGNAVRLFNLKLPAQKMARVA